MLGCQRSGRVDTRLTHGYTRKTFLRQYSRLGFERYVMQLEDKIALVTGAGRGMGRAISLQLAEEGQKLLCRVSTHLQRKIPLSP
ncbi:MAG: hypothetical protein Ct9H300mP11_26220 [Chloroflexota bacterium]|nr:MAG: hypothetical protein Ct9H300mP11_26220 [Chloroflexota bacterium]